MEERAWKKKGLVYSLDSRLTWARSHVQIPTADIVQDNRLAILFSSRDAHNRSHIGRLVVEADAPSRIISVSGDPLLSLGDLGTFDDCGMMPSSIVAVGDTRYLYYIGWNVRNTIPYHNSVGLAVSEDGGLNYERVFPGPIMDRTPEEPYFCATTCVIVENGIWRNWYLSCTGWDLIEGTPEPRYHLKYAQSSDGITWQRDGTVAIDFKSDAEGGIVRASVVKDGSIYKMWYCYRGRTGYRNDPSKTYRIGFAESADGIQWSRIDDGPILEPSDTGWDSEMVAYPNVVDAHGGRYLFYNGNGFGESGFGYARWE
jgi:hypothetical protein